MDTGYRRDKQKQQIKGDLRFVASIYLVGILKPLYCLTFDLFILFILSVSYGHCIVWPSICSFCLSRLYLVAIVLSDLRFVASVYLVGILCPLYCLTFANRRSDNTMAKRYRRDKQKLQIEGQKIQWPQDTDEINRSYKSKVKHYNGHKIQTR
jgi:hypothetical protein